jgi:hypothetical protein
LEDSLTNAGLDGLVQLETLAKRLSQGALPLGYASRCATDIASSLRDLHEEGRLHGSVNAESVVVTNTDARLLPPEGRARCTFAGADVAAFGALLYEMVTGAKPSPRATPPFSASRFAQHAERPPHCRHAPGIEMPVLYVSFFHRNAESAY